MSIRVRLARVPIICVFLVVGGAAGAAGEEAKPAGASSQALDEGLVDSSLQQKTPDPKLTGAMPFSSCSPDGAVILKGENLGSSPGKLRLVGHFPGPYVQLTQLEWTNTSIGGQVPDVPGALDQEVRIQAVRKDGRVTNSIRCQFTQRRVLISAPSDVMQLPVCYMGENSGTGCVLDGDPDSAKQLPTGCWHKNNSCGLPTDRNLYGKDEMRMRTLQNGWRYRTVIFSQPMFSDTEDEGVDLIRARAGGASFSWKGIKGGMTRFEVNTPRLNIWPEWEVPRGDIVHYGFSFEIEGPEGVPWEEPVSLPSTEQTLDDWNPIAPRGPASVDILKPGQGVLLVIGSGELVLDVSAGNASGNQMVELEWTHYVPGKDPSVEPYVVAHNAPRFVRLSHFPKSISFDLLNGLGRYGIRAKLKSSADNTWSDNRTFTLVDAEVHKTLVKAGALPTVGDTTQKAASRALRKAPGASPGEAKKSLGKQAAAQATPGSPGGGGSNEIRLQDAAGMQRTPIARRGRSGLAFDASSVKLEQPHPKTGAFGPDGLKVRNAGKGTSSGKGTRVVVTCSAVGPGSVKTLIPKLPLPPLDPGQRYPLGLAGACHTKTDGRYRVKVSVQTPGGTGAVWSREIRVGAADRLRDAKKAAGAATPTGPSPRKPARKLQTSPH